MKRTSLGAERLTPFFATLATGLMFLAVAAAQKPGGPEQDSSKVSRGEGAFNDWNNQRPGNRYLITPADLPKPYATSSATNLPRIVPRPADAWPKVPEGFKVDLLVGGLDNPRAIATAPNGDLFVAESEPGRVRVLRLNSASGNLETNQVFAINLAQPYGIAFYPLGPNPQYVYVANTNSVVRYPYQNGDLKARGAEETVVKALPYGGAHWTRDIVFSNDGKKMYIGVGSSSNVGDDASERNRADVLEFDPDGTGERIYASGIRNASGLTIHPKTNQLWVAVNERDALGDNLVPDYVTHIVDGGFYGWPWYYMGPNQDPRHAGKHPELKDKVLVPDVLVQSHSATLQLTFYNGKQFPAEYQGDIFVAAHGSWNRSRRTGYSILRVPTPNGKATGGYEDFVTGFLGADGNIWGRPVGVTVANDGSLIFTDDGSNSVWRVSYVGAKGAAVSK